MSRSVIVDVRKAVVAGVTTAVDDKHVSVSYGYKGSDETKRRKEIYTNRPRASHEPAVLRAGHTVRTETMDFDVCILVMDPSKGPADVDEVVMDLGEIVEMWVAQSKGGNLGITGLKWLIVVGLEIENRLMKTGSATLAQYTLRYEARLD